MEAIQNPDEPWRQPVQKSLSGFTQRTVGRLTALGLTTAVSRKAARPLVHIAAERVPPGRHLRRRAIEVELEAELRRFDELVDEIRDELAPLGYSDDDYAVLVAGILVARYGPCGPVLNVPELLDRACVWHWVDPVPGHWSRPLRLMQTAGGPAAHEPLASAIHADLRNRVPEDHRSLVARHALAAARAIEPLWRGTEVTDRRGRVLRRDACWFAWHSVVRDFVAMGHMAPGYLGHITGRRVAVDGRLLLDELDEARAWIASNAALVQLRDEETLWLVGHSSPRSGKEVLKETQLERQREGAGDDEDETDDGDVAEREAGEGDVGRLAVSTGLDACVDVVDVLGADLWRIRDAHEALHLALNATMEEMEGDEDWRVRRDAAILRLITEPGTTDLGREYEVDDVIATMAEHQRAAGKTFNAPKNRKNTAFTAVRRAYDLLRVVLARHGFLLLGTVPAQRDERLVIERAENAEPVLRPLMEEAESRQAVLDCSRHVLPSPLLNVWHRRSEALQTELEGLGLTPNLEHALARELEGASLRDTLDALGAGMWPPKNAPHGEWSTVEHALEQLRLVRRLARAALEDRRCWDGAERRHVWVASEPDNHHGVEHTSSGLAKHLYFPPNSPPASLPGAAVTRGRTVVICEPAMPLERKSNNEEIRRGEHIPRLPAPLSKTHVGYWFYFPEGGVAY